MSAKDRKAAFDKIDDPKPTWETFKRMMSMFDNDVEFVMEKWTAKEWKRKGWRKGKFVELDDE